jgi:hypothetical protein
VDEIYRMLGREHEADLEREAQRRRLAAELPRGSKAHRPVAPSRNEVWRRNPLQLVLAGAIALVGLATRVDPKEGR